MITKKEARAIAVNVIYEKTGWSSLPEDALLTHEYFSERRRWVFEWQHRTDLFSSDLDRILVWVSESGEILKLEVEWKPAPIPGISTNVSTILERSGIEVATAHAEDIKQALKERVREVKGIDVEILDYREILKRMFSFYIPQEEIKDYYWVGSDNSTIYLIDPDGHIVGITVIPSASKGSSTAGHYHGPNYHADENWCLCWTYLAKDVKSYFDKWLYKNDVEKVVYGCVDANPNDKSCTNDYISYSDYETSVSDVHTKIYHCTAHGGCRWFHFVPYTDYSCYAAVPVSYCARNIETLMENRAPMRFSFLIHCGAMDAKGGGTLEYVFRKGTELGVVIGLKHTTLDSWSKFHSWYPYLFSNIDRNRDTTIKEVYDDACDTYPDIKDHIDFTGSTSLTLKQIIQSDICKITR